MVLVICAKREPISTFDAKLFAQITRCDQYLILSETARERYREEMSACCGRLIHAHGGAMGSVNVKQLPCLENRSIWASIRRLRKVTRVPLLILSCHHALDQRLSLSATAAYSTTT